MRLNFGSSDRHLSVTIDTPGALRKGVGVSRLDFPLRVDSRNTLPAGMPLAISAQAWLAIQSDWLGFAVPERAVVTGEDAFLATLVLPLTDDQLAVMEERRAGGDLQIRIDLQITLGSDQDSVGSVGGFGQSWPTANDTADVYLQSGQWERLLEQSAVGTSLAVVVPVPIGRDAPATRAGAQLREAIRKINAGEYEDVVVSARRALDAMGDGWSSEKSVTADAPVARQRTALQRRTMLRHALFSLASLAAHDEPGTERVAWDRATALSVTAAVAAFVACGQPPGNG